jgi:anti-repressor protein
MNELEIFDFNNNVVRTKSIKNEPYFALVDVCNILGLDQPSRVKTRLKESGVTSIKVSDNSGFGAPRTYEMNFIDEPNLYKCIFQSRKAEAEKFQDWVTTEVLPKIRKHGMYATDELINNPDLLIQVASKLKEEKEARRIAEEQAEQRRLLLEEQKPKVVFADAVATSQTSILIRDLAKLLKQNGVDIGEKRVFKWLRENGYLIKQSKNGNTPTQKAMEQGLFEVKETSITHGNGIITTHFTSKVTGKGQIYFINKLKKEIEQEIMSI